MRIVTIHLERARADRAPADRTPARPPRLRRPAFVDRTAAPGRLTALSLLFATLGLTACETSQVPALQPLMGPSGDAGIATARTNASAGAPGSLPPAQFSYGTETSPTVAAAATAGGGVGDISLNFADTDIREVAAQILGNMLKVNYTIDPAVRGSVTLHTTTPLSRGQLLPTLQALLSQTGATLLQSDGLYRVVPAAAAATASIGGPNSAGSTVVPLRYAGADDLAKLVQPFAGASRVAADPGRNALVISGDPASREALVTLVRTFDIDILSGQSYALLPVGSGDAKDFASALQDTFRTQTGGALAGLVRAVPMERMNSVLLVSAQPRYIESARRVFAMVERARRSTVRGWQVTYLQNSHANDAAFVLQQAFTPGNVTVRPTSTGAGATAPLTQRTSTMGGAGGASTRSGAGGGGGMVSGSPLGGRSVLSAGGGTGAPETAATDQQQPLAAANPLLGGLDQTAGAVDLNTMRIIPNPQNNAVLIFGTPQEQETVTAMLRKIDILPLQVRIDATIAEVTLNDALRYGTQFFFRAGGINGILSNLSQSVSATELSAAQLATNFPGFVVGGSGVSGAPLAISLLQQVTTVHVLSSPELLVLDNHEARLEVGSLVPFLSQTSQSTLVSNAPVINAIDYRQTGVLLHVIPRVNSGGLVTLDISQAVSDVDTNPPTAPGVSINSPTFLDRTVESRVVVQDGQTVGLAGLIRDSAARGNAGIPWLKDIPILGALAGTQNNQRTRTELLVLITPHVVHDQRDARALTEDLREQLVHAAAVPQELQVLKASGSADPNARLRDRARQKLVPGQ